ncbi:MAG: VOC family protein [Candidatus Binatia bacterium]
MRLNGLRHLSLKTRDLKKTERFYTEILGLKIAYRYPPGMIFLRWPKGDDLLGS